jgi:phage terminase large subunit-like protein
MSGAAREIDPVAELSLLPPHLQIRTLRKLSKAHRDELTRRWWRWALPAQREPAGEWRIWLIRAGRGFGKTRAGAEWVSEFARANPDARIALVGATIDDARRVMIEGTSGLLAVARDDEELRWLSNLGELRFPKGATAQLFSAANPESLRGPDFDAAWCDELGKWKAPAGKAAWDNLMMALRRGERQRAVVTTTPRQTVLMQQLRAIPGFRETQGKTRDNPWLPESFVEAMIAEYGGTRLGRQELDGEMIDDVAGALWTRETIEACRVAAPPELVRVVIGVDPPVSADGDACGIVAVGLGRDERGYVIEDASVRGMTPEGWARAVAACAARHGADRVVAEKNQGGDMVASTLRAADAGLPVKLVSATRGKSVRAEPVSLLYEAGRVKHVGAWPELEDELCGLVMGGGYEGPGRSPDRADALVWALSALMVGKKTRAAVRAL